MRVPLTTPFALALSYVLEVLCLLGHAYRLARIRQAAREQRYELERGLAEDRALFMTTLRQLRGAEIELAQADLTFAHSRRAAVAAYRATVASIRARTDAQSAAGWVDLHEQAD